MLLFPLSLSPQTPSFKLQTANNSQMERLIYSSSPTKLVDLKQTSTFLRTPILTKRFNLSPSPPPHFPKKLNLVRSSNRQLPSSSSTSISASEIPSNSSNGFVQSPLLESQIDFNASRKVLNLFFSRVYVKFDV